MPAKKTNVNICQNTSLDGESDGISAFTKMTFKDESEDPLTPQKVTTSNVKQPTLGKTWRKQKFSQKWLDECEFQGWLAPDGDKFNAKCTYCNKVLKAARNALLKHKNSIVHRKNETKQNNLNKVYPNSKSEIMVKTSNIQNFDRKLEMDEITMAETFMSDETENVIVTEIQSSDAQFPTKYETQPPLLKNGKSDDRNIEMRLVEAYCLPGSPVQSNKKRDDCEVYGELVAMKLRKMDDVTRDIAMNKIDNLLFEIKMHPNKHNCVEKKICRCVVLPQETITSLSQQTSKQAKFTNFPLTSSPTSSTIFPTIGAQDI